MQVGGVNRSEEPNYYDNLTLKFSVKRVRKQTSQKKLVQYFL